MNITLPMLLTQLPEGHTGGESAEECHVSIRGIRLHIPKTNKEEDILYVGKYGTGLRLMLGSNVYYLNTDIRIEEEFNLLNEAFISLRDWDMNLHLGIIQNKGVQYLIDVSEEILKNPITFLDPGFKLVAYSHNNKSNEPIYRDIIKKGYMADEYIKELDVSGRLVDTTTTQKVFLQEKSDFFPQRMLISRIDVGHDFFGTVSLVLTETEYSRGLEELFDYFRTQIILYLESGPDRDAFRRHAFASLLTDIIDGKVDEETLNERNRYARLSLEGNFRLAKLTRREDAPHSLYYYLESQLIGRVPRSKVFSLRDDVLILTNSDNSDFPVVLDTINDVITENDLLCGISESFKRLQDIHRAFNQASAAIRIGELLKSNLTLKKLSIAEKEYGSQEYYYKDFYQYHCLELNDKLPDFYSMPAAFLKLFEKDQKEETDNLRVLYAYLNNECNKTHTAEVLYMHRNNINYRLRRIEEILGTDIDKDPLKTSLRIAFLVLEMIDPDELTNG